MSELGPDPPTGTFQGTYADLEAQYAAEGAPDTVRFLALANDACYITLPLSLFPLLTLLHPFCLSTADWRWLFDPETPSHEKGPRGHRLLVYP